MPHNCCRLPSHSVALRRHAVVYQIFLCERCTTFGFVGNVYERHGDSIFFSAGRPIGIKLLFSYSALRELHILKDAKLPG